MLDARFGRDDYLRLLGAFRGFYAPVETLIDGVDGWALLGLHGGERRKTGLLNADLEFFGVEPHALPMCADIPRLESVAAAAGCMYVLEGATLGGAVIRRQLGPTLHVAPGRGGNFFASYGDRVGLMWRQFGQGLEAFAAGAHADGAIVDAACETFDKLDQWLLACTK